MAFLPSSTRTPATSTTSTGSDFTAYFDAQLTGANRTSRVGDVRATRDPLQARFDIDAKLPAALRAEASGMDWGLFMATYAPSPTVHITLSEAGETNWLNHTFTAAITTLTKTERPETETREVTASGPASAVSELLNEHGRFVEMVSFHQITLHFATVTCVEVRHQVNHRRSAWAIGFGSTPEQSVAAAMSSGAQRIYGNL